MDVINFIDMQVSFWAIVNCACGDAADNDTDNSCLRAPTTDHEGPIIHNALTASSDG